MRQRVCESMCICVFYCVYKNKAMWGIQWYLVESKTNDSEITSVNFCRTFLLCQTKCRGESKLLVGVNQFIKWTYEGDICLWVWVVRCWGVGNWSGKIDFGPRTLTFMRSVWIVGNVYVLIVIPVFYIVKTIFCCYGCVCVCVFQICWAHFVLFSKTCDENRHNVDDCGLNLVEVISSNTLFIYKEYVFIPAFSAVSVVLVTKVTCQSIRYLKIGFHRASEKMEQRQDWRYRRIEYSM